MTKTDFDYKGLHFEFFTMVNSTRIGVAVMNAKDVHTYIFIDPIQLHVECTRNDVEVPDEEDQHQRDIDAIAEQTEMEYLNEQHIERTIAHCEDMWNDDRGPEDFDDE